MNQKIGPREKSLQFGVHTLSDAELLALLLGTGTRTKTVLQLSEEILSHASHSLTQLQDQDVFELMQIPGVGHAKALILHAAFELCKRQRSEQQITSKISSSRQAFEWAKSLLNQNTTEEFWAIYLNRANRILGHLRISNGGMNATIVDIRIIAKRAIALKASALIVFHNHPSGNTQPSQADQELTQKLKVGLGTLDLTLLDHLIVADSAFYSFADEGKL